MQKWITTWLAGNVLRILWKINWRFPNTIELCRRSVIWQQPIRTLPSLTETLYCFASRAQNRLRNRSDLLQIFKITLRGHPSYIFRCKTLSTFVTMHATPWYNVSAISCSHFVYLTAILTDFICSVLLLQKCLIFLAQSRPHVGYIKRNCRHDNSLAVRQCWTKRVKSLLVLSETSWILMVFDFVL